MPPAFYSDQLVENIILAVILLVPFVAIIIAAFKLSSRLRWPILLSSSILSLLWLTGSKVANNFPEFPHPHPVPTMFSLSMLLFSPSATVLIIATGLSLSHNIFQVLSLRKTIILGTSSLVTACLLGASLYVLFLHQGSELWTRVIPNGEWIRMQDPTHIPDFAAGGLAQQGVNFGVVSPIMAWISTGLLILGILSFANLIRMARQSNLGSLPLAQ